MVHIGENRDNCICDMLGFDRGAIFVIKYVRISCTCRGGGGWDKLMMYVFSITSIYPLYMRSSFENKSNMFQPI